MSIYLPAPSIWWRYDGNGSGSVTDYGSYNITGTIIRGPLTASSDGYDFNGLNQLVAATCSFTPNSDFMSFAVVCKADSFSSNETENPTRKIAIAFGIGDTSATTNLGFFVNFERTTTSPPKARIRVSTFTTGGVQTNITSDDDIVNVTTKVFVAASYDRSGSIARLLFADASGSIKRYSASRGGPLVFDASSPQFETGRHRQSDHLDRYWDGTIKEAQMYNGYALDFCQMTALAEIFLNINFFNEIDSSEYKPDYSIDKFSTSLYQFNRTDSCDANQAPYALGIRGVRSLRTFGKPYTVEKNNININYVTGTTFPKGGI